MSDEMTDTTVDAPVVEGEEAVAPEVKEDDDEAVAPEAGTMPAEEDDDEAEKPVAEEGETPEAPAL